MAATEFAETQTKISEQDDAISSALVDARLSARPLQEYPGQLPETMEQAYAIQAASIARWSDEVAGWKVAMLSPDDSSRFGAERLAGPIFRSLVHTAQPGSRLSVPIYEGGFAAVEAEFVLELGATVQPIDKDYSDDELVDLIRAVYGGAEIASSPMVPGNTLGPACTASDFGINGGVVVGLEITDWRSHLQEPVPTTVTVDDVEAGHTDAATLAGSPLQALRFLINLSASRGIELPAGTLVSSGAITGVHRVQLSSAARIDYGSFGLFDLVFEAMVSTG